MGIHFLIRGTLDCGGERAKGVFDCVLKKIPKGLRVGDSSHPGEGMVSKDSRKPGVPKDHLEFCAGSLLQQTGNNSIIIIPGPLESFNTTTTTIFSATAYR